MAKSSQELAASAAGITTEDMGEKVRVHALAKALGVTSAELITVLDGQGIQGKRAQSTLPKAQVGEVLEALKSAGTEAPAAETAPKKTPARKAPARKAAPKKTAAAKAPARKADAEKDEPKKAPAKRTRKAPAKAQAAQDAPVKDAAAEAAPEAQAPAKAAQKKDEPKKAPAAKKSPAKKQPAKKSAPKKTTAKKAPVQEAPVADTADTTDTVDALIDRIAGSVEESAAETTAPAAKNTENTDKTADKAADKATGKTAGDTAEQADEAPRKVRRRVVRRVGSRTAASDAELLRSRKAEQDDRKGGASSQDASKSGAGDNAGDSGDAASDRHSAGDDERDAVQGARSRRRGRRGRGRGRGDQDRENQAVREEVTAQPAPAEQAPQEPADDHGVPEGLPVLTEGADVVDEPVKLKGSTRLESKRRWRQEQGHDKKKIVSKAEFLARRENVDRAMVVRDSERSDHPGTTTQVGITEDGMLVEHVVTSETQSSIIGNIYLGRVQNVLSSMEAAFIDIGTGRNAVLYAGEVDWRNKHLHARTRRIEAALKPGDQVLVQAIKDPLGHKGARLTNRLSFAGRYLVYVPGGKTQGISRKLPEAERKRLKDILGRVVPDNGGTIIRTAAEGVSEELIAEDVNRLHQRWLDIQDAEEKARERKGTHPVAMYEEPNMLVKVIRDIFNEDFNELVVDGEKSWAVVRDYVHHMAPDLESRLVRYRPEEHGGRDVFADRQLDEQLAKALSRKVWLPSGGYLIIDRTEAMTVIDVNTGSFVGSGGNLEETVTLTNLEAAEEIVRQMRLRDMGGMIVVDFIDMVLPENRDLMLRRLSEFLGRDRTRHKVSEVTSLGLVQMTRKRLGTGLLETFSTECPTCGGRGVIIHDDPVEHTEEEDDRHERHGHGQHGQHSHNGQSDRRDHGNRAEKRQAREQQETKRRHEQAREEQAKDAGSAGAGSADSEVTEDRSTGKSPAAEQEHSGRSRRTRRGSRSGDAAGRDSGREESGRQDSGRRQSRTEEKAQDRSQDRRSGADASGDAASHGDHGDRRGAERTEPQEQTGSRRGRRRVVRRVGQTGQDDRTGSAERNGRKDRADRTDRNGRTDRDDRAAGASEVAAIAAQAVVHAGVEDPDEPSGADYVPNEEKATDAAPQAGMDRRGRRRVRRVVRPAAGRDSAPEKSRAPEKATKKAPVTAPEKAPAKVAAAEPVPAPAGQTYAEAKAEFDASPRRRRRTRGRSRSDVAPQAADFPDSRTPEAPAEQKAPKAPKAQKEQKAAPAPETPQARETPAGNGAAAPASRRGRRRVVRSSRH